MDFDQHAIEIAQRQYFQEYETNLEELFERVSSWVARPEGQDSGFYQKAFYDLMASKRFCPGGRVLAGAGTSHGNVLNCFVQDGSPEPAGTNEWILALATKLALVTKVGGGNGLCLDPIRPKQDYDGKHGQLWLTVSRSHPDYQKVKDGTYFDLVHGEYVTKGYRHAIFLEQDDALLKSIVIPSDSVEGIWESANRVVHSILAGEDICVDLTSLRSEGSPVKGSGGNSSGPSSFAVEVFDNFAYWAYLGGAAHAGPVATLRYIFAPTLRVIRQGGTRRGAGMATLSIYHPDIKDFITAKDLEREQKEGDISTFNISVLADDYCFSHDLHGRRDELKEIAHHAWKTGEPGLIFIDRINQNNAMAATMGDIKATNPCGEIPLYPGEPCDLGAMNLSAYVEDWWTGLDGFDFTSFEKDVSLAVRFLDNVLDVNHFALADNREKSMSLRRLGLGVMGLADALIKMGYAYNADEGRAATRQIMMALRDAAQEASESLAIERGIFPLFEDSVLNEERRNVALLTVAPTGTTSMLMGVSSGIEPVFAPFIYRKIGSSYSSLIHPLFESLLTQTLPHYKYAQGGEWNWEKVIEAVQDNHGSVRGLEFVSEEIQRVFVCAHDVDPKDHVKLQGVVQTTFDNGPMLGNSISKTINMPHETTVEDVFNAYALAFDEGCKGITVYRDGSRQFQVLSTKKTEEETFDRPSRLTGFTDQVSLTDSLGQKRGFYVTVNEQGGKPTEVFISSGKAGDEVNADSEALGRLTSIALQHGIDADVIVGTLRGINGGMYGTYQGRMVTSKADLIAVALHTADEVGQCPECSSPLQAKEGCMMCETCGYGKCG